jgi:hypothetical protein
MSVSTQEKAAPRYEHFVEEQLTRAQRRIRWLDTGTALLIFGIVTLGYALGMALLDRWFELSAYTRQAAFAVYALVTGIYLVWAVVRPLLQNVNPYYAAQQVERTLPDAKNSLVNWLDLKERQLPGPIRGAVTHRAAKDFAHADIEQAFDAHRAVWLSAFLLALAFGLVILFLQGPPQFFSLLDRTFAPFRSSPLATRTQLHVLKPAGGDATVQVGRAVGFQLRVDGRIPDRSAPDAIKFLFRYQPNVPYEERAVDQGETTCEFTLTLPAYDVHNGFSYMFQGGDAETPEFQIRVRSAPLVTDFDVTYHFRAYLRRADQTSRDPNLDALEGTDVTLIAHTNRVVRSGRLQVGEEETVEGQLVSTDPRALRFPLTIKSDGTYKIAFVSSEGEKSEDSAVFTIHAIPDHPPVVEISEPRDVTLPANGILKVRGSASDDFGLERLSLHMLKCEPDVMPYRNGKSLRTDDGSYPRRVDYMDFVDLSKVQMTGRPLQPGEVIEYWLEARDNCDFRENVDQSKHYKITIAGPQDPRQQARQRQQAQADQDRHEQEQQQQVGGKPDDERKDGDKPAQGSKDSSDQQEGKDSDLQNRADQLSRAIDEQKRNENKQQEGNAGQDKQRQEKQAGNDSGGDSQANEKQSNQGNGGGSGGKQEQQQQEKQDSKGSGGDSEANQKQSDQGNQGDSGSKQDQQRQEKQGGNGSGGNGQANQKQSDHGSQGGSSGKQDQQQQDKQGGKDSGGDSQGNQKQSDQGREGGSNGKQDQAQNPANRGKDNPGGSGSGDGNQNKDSQSKENGGSKSQGDGKAGGNQVGDRARQKPSSKVGDKDAVDNRGRADKSNGGGNSSQGTKISPDQSTAKGSKDGEGERSGSENKGGSKNEGAQAGGNQKSGQKGQGKPSGNKSDGMNATGEREAQKNGNDGRSGSERSKGAGQKADGASGDKQAKSPENSDADKERKGAAQGDQERKANQADTGTNREEQAHDNAGKHSRSDGNEAGKSVTEQAHDSAGTKDGAETKRDASRTEGAKGGGDKEERSRSSQSSRGDKESQESGSKQANKDAGTPDAKGRGNADGAGQERAATDADVPELLKRLKNGDASARRESLDKLNQMKDGIKDPGLRQKVDQAVEESGLLEKAPTGNEQSPGRPGDRQVQPKDGGNRSTEQSTDRTEQPQPNAGTAKNGQGLPTQPSGSQESRGGDSSQVAGKRVGEPTNGADQGAPSAADPRFQRMAGQLQLDYIKKHITPDVLKKLNMTPQEYQQFLKHYAERAMRQTSQPGNEEKLTDPRANGNTVLSRRSRQVKPGALKEDRSSHAGQLEAPPEYRESYRDFTQKLAGEKSAEPSGDREK